MMREMTKALLESAGFYPKAVSNMNMEEQTEKFVNLVIEECVWALDLPPEKEVIIKQAIQEHFED